MRQPARVYRVVKVPYGTRFYSFVVVSEDLEDPNLWVVIERFFTAPEAFRYVDDITHRQAVLQ